MTHAARLTPTGSSFPVGLSHPGLVRHSSFGFRHSLVGVLFLLFAWTLFADEVIPPAPSKYFNDYAGVVSPGTAAQLNTKLEQLEKDSSNQIVVAIYPKMQSDSSIEDYAQRVFVAWKIGQKEKNNGALLLVFIHDRKMRIHTGYGLEGALPDITCKRIIEDEIIPYFKKGDYNAGLTAGVNAMIAATRGEYKGTGRTVAQNRENQDSGLSWIWIVLIFAFIIWLTRKGGGTSYSRSGRWGGGGGWYIGGGGGGGSWRGGGDSGGGFSGGGGDSGGGGSSGSW